MSLEQKVNVSKNFLALAVYILDEIQVPNFNINSKVVNLDLSAIILILTAWGL